MPEKNGKKRTIRAAQAVVAVFALIGGSAGSIIAKASFFDARNPWVWSVFVVALMVIFVLEIWRQKQTDEREAGGEVRAADQFLDTREQYLKRIVDRFRYLPLRTIDYKTADAETSEQDRLNLPDVYIDMDTTTREGMLAEKEGMGRGALAMKSKGREEEKPVSALDALIHSPRMVLLGDPGGGKSTFFNHLAFCLAGEALDPKADWISRLRNWPDNRKDLLPTPIVLRELAAWFIRVQPHQRGVGMLNEYLGFWLENMGLGDFRESLDVLLKEGRALLLIDGLDEVPDREDVLERVKEMIDDLPAAFPLTPIAVTCRVISYQDPRWRLASGKWPVFELAKLDEKKIDRFITAWYRQLAGMRVVKDHASLSAGLSHAVRRPDLWRLAANPLLLTVMALVHTHKGELPEARALLYADVVDLLLWRWEAVKLENPNGSETTWRQLLREAELGDIDMKEALWALAFHSHGRMEESKGVEATADIAKADLLEELRTLHPEQSYDWANRMIQIMNLRAGLLVETGPNVYSFPHRTFEEYLAGCHLSVSSNFTGEAVDLARQGAFWWEVVLLAVGSLVHSGKTEATLVLVDELCPEKAPGAEDVDGWRNIWLAGKSLLEIGLIRTKRRNLGRTLMERVPRHLTRLITRDILEPRKEPMRAPCLAPLETPGIWKRWWWFRPAIF